LEGLFVVVAIVVGLLNFAAKQQRQNQNQNQGNMKRQLSQRRQEPVRWKEHIEQQLERAAGSVRNIRDESAEGKVPYMPEQVSADDYEGIELEDRRSEGSLNYIEQSKSSEGECDEHPEHRQPRKKDRKEKKTAPAVEVLESEESPIFDLTEESLLRSIVMAEVLGPPRVIKRRIR